MTDRRSSGRQRKAVSYNEDAIEEKVHKIVDSDDDFAESPLEVAKRRRKEKETRVKEKSSDVERKPEKRREREATDKYQKDLAHALKTSLLSEQQAETKGHDSNRKIAEIINISSDGSVQTSPDDTSPPSVNQSSKQPQQEGLSGVEPLPATQAATQLSATTLGSAHAQQRRVSFEDEHEPKQKIEDAPIASDDSEATDNDASNMDENSDSDYNTKKTASRKRNLKAKSASKVPSTATKHDTENKPPRSIKNAMTEQAKASTLAKSASPAITRKAIPPTLPSDGKVVNYAGGPVKLVASNGIRRPGLSRNIRKPLHANLKPQ